MRPIVSTLSAAALMTLSGMTLSGSAVAEQRLTPEQMDAVTAGGRAFARASATANAMLGMTRVDSETFTYTEEDFGFAGSRSWSGAIHEGSSQVISDAEAESTARAEGFNPAAETATATWSSAMPWWGGGASSISSSTSTAVTN